MLSKNINRLISYETEEHNCSGNEETESGTWTIASPHFPSIGGPGLYVKIHKIH
jgi:hypothetical protein